MRLTHLLSCLLLMGLLAGCANLALPAGSTPIPTGELPTIIALTLEASGLQIPPTPTRTSRASATIVQPTFTEIPPASPTLRAPSPIPMTLVPTATDTLLAQLTFASLEGTATLTPLPAVPDARVQIYRLGELSLITSPIQITARLTSRVGKVVRVDLYGEDGRLLSRQVKTFNTVPWTAAMIGMDLAFEVHAAAEVGRLVISVEDSYGRIIDVNSVNLILLSQGITEIKPASALVQAIVIQDPLPKTLIQGGKLYVSGLARPFNQEQPLNVALITQDGRTVGQRLAGVAYTTPGFHGTFFAEVPYTVSDLTPALLVVYEAGGVISQYSHLTSMEVLLSP